jgi:hypothetical protein
MSHSPRPRTSSLGAQGLEAWLRSKQPHHQRARRAGCIAARVGLSLVRLYRPQLAPSASRLQGSIASLPPALMSTVQPLHVLTHDSFPARDTSPTPSPHSHRPVPITCTHTHPQITAGHQARNAHRQLNTTTAGDLRPQCRQLMTVDRNWPECVFITAVPCSTYYTVRAEAFWSIL